MTLIIDTPQRHHVWHHTAKRHMIQCETELSRRHMGTTPQHSSTPSGLQSYSGSIERKLHHHDTASDPSALQSSLKDTHPVSCQSPPTKQLSHRAADLTRKHSLPNTMLQSHNIPSGLLSSARSYHTTPTHNVSPSELPIIKDGSYHRISHNNTAAHPACSRANSKAAMVSSRASCSVLPDPATAERLTLSRYNTHSSRLAQLSKPSCSTCPDDKVKAP